MANPKYSRSPLSMKAKIRVVTFPIVALALVICISGIASTGKGQPWLEKDWTKWTSEDCTKVLYDSPWVSNHFLELTEYTTTDIAQLRSALPLRQSVLRQLQIDKHYDKMTAQQKQAFDQLHASDLAEGDGGRIVLYVHHKVSFLQRSGDDTLYHNVPKSADPARLGYLALHDGGNVGAIQTTELRNTTYENEYLYSFPRNIDGKPAVGTSDKVIFFNFGDVFQTDKHKPSTLLNPSDNHGNPSVTGHGYEFDMEKLIYKGKVEY